MRSYNGLDAVRMPLNHLSQDKDAIVLIPVQNDWSVFGGPETVTWVVLEGQRYGEVSTGPADTCARELIDAGESKQTFILAKVTATGHLVPITDDGTVPEHIANLAQEAISNLGW
jgi:hypothetical protein